METDRPSPFRALGILVKIIIAIGALFLAYLLFRYAMQKGDWGFIADPIRNLMRSM
jgi:hypothetical protein